MVVTAISIYDYCRYGKYYLSSALDSDFFTMKAIAILRVSTKAQTIDDQRGELISFAKAQGYDEIIPIEAVGASAIKMDDKYMELVKKVKDTILSDRDIKAACVWELSRLGRNEVILMEFKEFFIKNNIQFICKNPYMKLLEDDGRVNAGMELAFSLFSTMSKQEMQEKKERFKRAKKSMASKGQYIGGHTIKYGYKVEDGFFVENSKEADVVRSIFQLYSTGEYSTYTLARELRERGIGLSDRQVARILKSEAYTGKEVVNKYTIHYPPIISQELFDKALEVRDKNRIDMKRGKRLLLGAKLVRCPKCGAVCTSNSRHYVCCRSNKGGCENRFALRQSVADNLLWRVASIIHVEYLTNLTADKEEEYRKDMAVLNQKIDVLAEKVKKAEVKKARIVESYMDGLIDRETRDTRLLKVKDEVDIHKKSITSLQEKRDALAGILENLDKDMDYIEALTDAALMEYDDDEDKYAIIHKHIVSLTAVQQSYGERDKRTTRPNAVLITINTAIGDPWKFLYFPKFYKGSNLYVWNGKTWRKDMF